MDEIPSQLAKANKPEAKTNRTFFFIVISLLPVFKRKLVQ
jgi:hypothetical protein